MTVERMIELLEIEKECVLRNAIGECNRYCAGCDLLQDDTELHEMYTEAIALLKEQEAVDAAPVVHGRWIEIDEGDGDYTYDCSVCGGKWWLAADTPEENGMKYCPYCGAKMKEDE